MGSEITRAPAGPLQNASHDGLAKGSSASGEAASFRRMVREAVREVESRIILEALVRHQWNRRRTAEALSISYRSLMYKMKYCKLRQPDVLMNPEANR
jgi:DNA-binding NtrC family response regulator